MFRVSKHKLESVFRQKRINCRNQDSKDSSYEPIGLVKCPKCVNTSSYVSIFETKEEWDLLGIPKSAPFCRRGAGYDELSEVLKQVAIFQKSCRK